jgi:hypothetical protein
MMQGEDGRIILSSCAVEHCLNPFKVESYEKQIFQPFLPLPGFSTLNAKAVFGATEHFRSTNVAFSKSPSREAACKFLPNQICQH